MKYYALLSVIVVLSMFVTIGCDDPPKPDDATVYDKKLDGEPSIYSLEEVVVVEKAKDSAEGEKSTESEEDEEAEEIEEAEEDSVKPPVNTSEKNKRKTIFYELVQAQDKMGTENGDKHMMKKYNFTYDQLISLKVEGVKKNWPMPKK